MELAPGERIRWSAPAELPGAMVLLADGSARRWRLFHETYTFCTGISISKPAGWRYRGRTFYQPADGLQLMEPGEVHANTEITQPASFRVLLVPPELMRRASELFGMAALPHFKTAQLAGGPIHRAFRRLHESLEQESTPLERESRFAECIRLVLLECTDTGARAPADATPASVARAIAYLHEHATRAISLQELSRAAGASNPYGLVRAFAAHVGLPPHAYQIQLRIAQARHLLRIRVAPAEAAAQLGFADQSHFGRHFRRGTGMTPARFARAISS